MTKQPACVLADLLKALEAIAPARLAEDWDNPATLAEAMHLKADAIVAHHPLIFKPLQSVHLAQPVAALAGGLLRAGIALVAAHTNLDAARWGTNQALAEACGLVPEAPLLPREDEPQFKLAVFVPSGHETAIIEAIARGGGGRIGAYTHCTFRTSGTGTFLGAEHTRPFIGEPGRLESADEYRIEAVVAESARAAVVRALKHAHPYEEVAYDLYPLSPIRREAGLGCLATLPEKTTAEDLARDLKERLGLACLRLSGPPCKKIRHVALCSGSGGSFIGKAATRADAFITGEINYHQAIEAHARGIAVLELGHFESEVLVARPLAEKLAQAEKLALAGVDVLSARCDRQPFRYFT